MYCGIKIAEFEKVFVDFDVGLAVAIRELGEGGEGGGGEFFVFGNEKWV